MCLWVDDIIYCGKDDDFVDWFEKGVKTKFRVSECCMLSWILGTNVTVIETSITVNQEKYIKNLLKQFGMSDCKALSTPMAEHVYLTKGCVLWKVWCHWFLPPFQGESTPFTK